ncbi:MAG TPA: hypothetical protein VEG27_00195 [Usitatibacter sp.]|nr:hypothetical protein [Usitatibacter sp.]
MKFSNRRIGIALALSLAAHVAFFVLAPRPRERPLALASLPGPLVVTIEKPAPPEPAATQVPQSGARPPAPRVAPRPPPRRVLTARPNTPAAAAPVPPLEVPKPVPAPPPSPPEPKVDMLAMINARRELRRQAEAAEAARESVGIPGAELPGKDEVAGAIERNLQSLTRDDRTGGIFTILDKGIFTAEYAFNGWRPDTHRRWREVIEVKAKSGEDIDLAIVRSMIALIRTHYSGDFLWDSRRLGRVVTLSARAEDNVALEQFLLREFFGTPVLKPEIDR